MPAPVFRYNQLLLSNTHRFETLIVDFHRFFLLYSSVFSVITILCVGVDLSVTFLEKGSLVPLVSLLPKRVTLNWFMFILLNAITRFNCIIRWRDCVWVCLYSSDKWRVFDVYWVVVAQSMTGTESQMAIVRQFVFWNSPDLTNLCDTIAAWSVWNVRWQCGRNESGYNIRRTTQPLAYCSVYSQIKHRLLA